MLGLLCRVPGRWGKVSLDLDRVLSLPVVRAELAGGAWSERRQLSRAVRLLERQGVRRLLPRRESDAPAPEGLRWVDPTPMCRYMAAPLALAELERRGEDPHRTRIALRSRGVDSALERTARLLCPTVRELVIDVPFGGERLAKRLYWDYGVAVCPGGGADLSVRFGGTPEVGEEGFLLYGSKPDLGALALTAPGLTVPEELEPLPVLCALWESGRLGEEELKISIL